MISTTPAPCRWCGLTREEHRGPGLCPVGKLALFRPAGRYEPAYQNSVEPQYYCPPAPLEPARTPESIRAQWSGVTWRRKKSRAAEALAEIRASNKRRLTTEPNVSIDIRKMETTK